jgi:hypothetical protein
MPSPIVQSNVEFSACSSGELIAQPSCASEGMLQLEAASAANAV